MDTQEIAHMNTVPPAPEPEHAMDAWPDIICHGVQVAASLSLHLSAKFTSICNAPGKDVTEIFVKYTPCQHCQVEKY
jgi:hypothetical protein